MEFDRRRHPDVIPGGLWLNKGFSSDESVPKGYVDLSGVIFEYEKPSMKTEEKKQEEAEAKFVNVRIVRKVRMEK